MGFSYKQYDAVGLAELVKKKEISAKEVVQSAMKEIDRLNPKLNAVINKFYEKALKAAENPDLTKPFAGVPILLKDITQEIEGEKITSGSKAFQQYRAMKDTEFVKRLRNSGMIFMGQTNVPEFALMGITEPSYYGPTRNPWNLDHTPGGSSGGSAAAVASGMVPIAGANDGGGSIRIPGAYTGLFGIKPTRGRNPVGPNFGRHWQGASVDHVLTRSVRDSAAILDEVSVQEKGAAFLAPPFYESYLKQLEKPLSGKKRIAFWVKSPIGTEVHSECKQAVLHTAKILEEMGHIVEEREAPVDGKKIATSYLTMYFGEVAAAVHQLKDVLGRKPNMNDVEPTTWLLSLLGKATTAEEFVLGLREWDKAAFAMEEFHETYDFYLTPTTAFPPAKIGELEPGNAEKLAVNIVGKLGAGGVLKKTGIVDQIAEKNLMRTPFTQLANLTGQPAITLPLYQTADGLPCGVQVMAARGKEDLLFQLAHEFEQTEHWIDVSENKLFGD